MFIPSGDTDFTKTSAPNLLKASGAIKGIQIQSERLDAVIAKTYSLSREDAQALIKRSLVFVNGKETASSAYTPKVGDKISVRGHGRLIYQGFDSTSRKGKLNAIVEIYV